MTAAQIVVSIGAILASQLLPQLMFRTDGQLLSDHEQSWWILAMPPAWFAGIDDVLTTGFPLCPVFCRDCRWPRPMCRVGVAFDRLVRDYAAGLQTIGETISRRPSKTGRRGSAAIPPAPAPLALAIP